MLNVFRIVGDSSHVLGIFILFGKYLSSSSSAGVSARTQFLFTLTYILRYSDLFTSWVSYYNAAMKLFLIFASSLSMFLVLCILRRDYEKKYDTFWVEFIMIPSTILALLVNHEYSILEVCWTWSIYVEAFALIPQFWMSWKGGRVDGYLIFYVLALLTYRGSYIGNWVYRYYTEDYFDLIASIAGVVETIVGLFGLMIMIYKFHYKDGYAAPGGTHGNPSIYTLPFVNNFGQKGFLGHGDQSKMSKGNPEIGPYNPDLSVPILQYEETEYPNNNA